MSELEKIEDLVEYYKNLPKSKQKVIEKIIKQVIEEKRKTAEAIFSEIESAYYNGSIANPNSEDFFETKLAKLKKEFFR